MTKVNEKKLQRLIDAAAKGHTAAYNATQALCRYSIEVWGFEPGDRDCDRIIDSCLGGCGASRGMPVEEFIEEMDSVAGD